MNVPADVTLPLASSPSPDHRRVLVVEDCADNCRLVAALLRHAGLSVQTASDGRLGLETAHSFRPHFILLDIGLPGLDGYQVAELVHDDLLLSDVIIIAVSAYGPDIQPERCHQARFDHHLTKPISVDDLLPLLNLHRD